MIREPLVIIGAGDHGRVVLEMARSLGIPLLGFVEPDIRGRPRGANVDGLRVVGDLAEGRLWIANRAPCSFVVTLGDNRKRQLAYGRARELGLAPVSLVHPKATLLAGAEVGPGSQICAGAIIGVAASVRENVIVNTGATIDHDVELAAHSFIAPGVHLAGRVRIGEGAFVGIGAVVRDGCTVGAGALVAAGAVVVEDVPSAARVYGVPARARLG
jgi:sugar O-acyltransferase (sialic acid O-acetyltransferase NeuD family)